MVDLPTPPLYEATVINIPTILGRMADSPDFHQSDCLNFRRSKDAELLGRLEQPAGFVLGQELDGLFSALFVRLLEGV